jgi:hypothetical protein
LNFTPSSLRCAARTLLSLACLLGSNQASAQSATPAIAALKLHITGAAPLDDAQIKAQADVLEAGMAQVATNAPALAAAFDLVETYDAKIGPLFTTPDTKKGFPRDAAENVLTHALFDVQQGILDYAYTPANLMTQAKLLDGAKFGTAVYFPGAVNPPADDVGFAGLVRNRPGAAADRLLFGSGQHWLRYRAAGFGE